MFPPPGFSLPLWRSDGKTDLALAVTSIEKSLGGCHRAKVVREVTNGPSTSNLHYYVKQVPHKCELLPATPKRIEKKGILNWNGNWMKIWSFFYTLDFLLSEIVRVKTSMQFVNQMNAFSRQKAGGFINPPSIPKVMDNSCPICVTRGTCLGKSCLGDKGLYYYYTIHS